MGQGFDDFGFRMSGASDQDITNRHLEQIQRQNQENQAKYGVADIALDPNTLAQQQAFIQQLQQSAMGQGPSVVQQMLQNAQSQNAANANSLIAGQRGVNPGMAARQALMSNANANQVAAGQAAAGRNQEMLNSRAALGNQLNNMQQQKLQMGAQNQNSALASKGMASGLEKQTQAQGNDMMGGLLQGAGTAAMMLLAKGGMVKMADGGGISPIAPINTSGPMSAVGQYMADIKQPTTFTKMGSDFSKQMKDKFSDSDVPDMSGQSQDTRPDDAFMPGDGFAKGGRVPAMVSPGERYLPPAEVKKVAEGKKDAMKAGERIPGEPKVSGAKDSYANDTVKKTLESGGIVLPRHITQAKDAPEKAAAFVQSILARQGLKKR